MDELALSPLYEMVRPILVQRATPVYLVGGAVRDGLLGRASHDLDFAVPERAIELAFQVGNALHWPAYVLDAERDIGRVVVELATGERTMLDFARYRGADLAADLYGRDFTINALAVDAARPAGEVIDLFGGLADLAARRLHLVHTASLQEDPVRALRAVRLAQSLGFTLSGATRQAVAAAATILQQSSAERLRDELLKMMALDHPHRAIEQMAEEGLLAAVLPEIAALGGVSQSPPHHEDVLAHTISVLRWLPLVETAVWEEPEQAAADEWRERLWATVAPYRRPLRQHLERAVDGGLDGRTLLRLGALFHDCGKKATRTVDESGRIRFFEHEQAGARLTARRLQALALSQEASNHVRLIVLTHMRPHNLADNMAHLANMGHAGNHAGDAPLPSRRAVYRYFRAARSAGLDVALLSLADDLARYNGPGPQAEWARACAVVAHLFHLYFTSYEEVILPPRLVDGRALMQALALKPGPEVGRLLSLIQEAQASGEVVDAEGALALARRRVRPHNR
jgi:putative nucleotidyltransferase with HDIG domain